MIDSARLRLTRLFNFDNASERLLRSPLGAVTGLPGLDLVRHWGVPAENRFVQRQGHFGSAIKLMREDAPLQRLVTVMGEAAKARQ